MGRGVKAVLVKFRDQTFGIVPGRTPGALGHGKNVRPQFHQSIPCFEQLFTSGISFWGEKFEAQTFVVHRWFIAFSVVVKQIGGLAEDALWIIQRLPPHGIALIRMVWYRLAVVVFSIFPGIDPQYL